LNTVNVYGEVHVHTNESKANVGKSPAEMAIIKRAAKQRDDNTCQVCGEKDKILECHHIFPQSKYPDMVADLSNIITLCQSCHRKYHSKYDGAEGAVSFSKYMRDNGEIHG